MATVTRYPTRSLHTWQKMKELRRKYNRLGWDARLQGGVVLLSQHPAHPLFDGIGLWGRRVYGPYFSKAMQEPDRLSAYHEAADVRGYPRGEMCSSMHHYVGELLTGHATLHPWSGEQSPVDFVFEIEPCPSMAKMAQLAAEHLGVPHFIVGVPHGGGDAWLEYLVGRMQDAIAFLERIVGRQFDDERLIEGAINWWEQGVLCARICDANKAVPAPLDFGMLLFTLMLGYSYGSNRDVVDCYLETLAEVEEQVEDGISAHGVETVRLTHEGEPMYYAPDFVPDLVKRYGGVFVGGHAAFGAGIYSITEDGRWTPAPRFADLGIALRGRQDALAFLARAYALHSPGYHDLRLEEKVGEFTHRAQDWHCGGMILHMDIGCRTQAAGAVEARLALQQAGIPSVAYQASNSDAMNFSAGQVSGAIESFLERLGLRPI